MSEKFVLLRFQHDVILAYVAVTTLLPIVYFGFSIRYRKTSYSRFSIWYHLGTCMFLVSPIINSIHDLAINHDAFRYTIGSEVVMAVFMGLLAIGETIVLYTFVKSTWRYVTFTPYVSYFARIRNSFSRKSEYELVPLEEEGDDEYEDNEEEGEIISATVPETIEPLSWRKWFTIDLMLNWYCSQLLLTAFHVFMYSLRARSIFVRNTGSFNNRQLELAAFSGLTGGMTLLFVVLDLWLYRMYTSSNFLFYLTAMIYYFGCLTEYFVSVSRLRMDYVTMIILCAVLTAFVVKIGVAQVTKMQLYERIKIKRD